MANKDQCKYQSGIRKMMHMMRLSRLNIYSATYNGTRDMILAERTNYDAIVSIIDYPVHSRDMIRTSATW